MMSFAQHVEKLERVKKVVYLFLKYDNMSINKISKILKVSSSTVQRDLNDVDYIMMIYRDKAKEKLQRISEKLKQNNTRIKKETNEFTGDENGKITSNKKR